MGKVFVTREVPGRAIDMLRGAGHEVDVWPDALPPELKAGATTIRFAAPDETTREITIEAPDDHLIDAVRAAVGTA